MSNVIDFAKAKEAQTPHASGTCYCMACRHEWVAVWPVGTTQMECPECQSMRGRSKYNYGPEEGALLWSCTTCENQLFNLLPDRVHCPGCGKQWRYEELGGSK